MANEGHVGRDAPSRERVPLRRGLGPVAGPSKPLIDLVLDNQIAPPVLERFGIRLVGKPGAMNSVFWPATRAMARANHDERVIKCELLLIFVWFRWGRA